MMTVNEVSKLSGVSIRTLQYYDSIGLLPPAQHTDAGYRLYDETVVETLREIMLFRELEFSLKEIKAIISAPDFDRKKALRQQIELLTLKREHLDNLIRFARGIEMTGDKAMDFSAFDKSKQDEYAKKAKAQWGKTEAYKEFEEKSKGRNTSMEQAVAAGMMLIFEDFGKIKDTAPEGEQAQTLVKKLQGYISENFYNCTREILSGLGQMYAAGGEFTDNIEKAGGAGTAQFASDAIEIFCR